MNTRILMVALGAVASFGMVVCWQLLDDAPPVGAEIPQEVEPEWDGNIVIQPAELAEPEDEPAQRQLMLELPKLPELDNNPAGGALWVQVVEDATGLPMAGEDCRVLCFDYGTNDYDWDTFGITDDLDLFENRTTDRHGLVRLDTRFDDSYDPSIDTHVICNEDYGVRTFALPVPDGWYPARSLEAIRGEINTLYHEPGNKPVRVPMRRTATLELKVVNERGNPVQEAWLYTVAASPSRYSPPESVWLDRFARVSDYRHHSYIEDELTSAREQYKRSRIQGSVNENKLEGATMRYLEDDAFRTDDLGGYVQESLPRTRFAVFAWHPQHGIGECDVTINEVDQLVTITLIQPETATLNLRVEWHDIALDDRDMLTLSLLRSGPCGRHDAMDGFCFEWHLPSSKTHLWVGRIEGIPPGYWDVRARLFGGEGENSRHLHLGGNESVNVTLLTGDESYALWRPTITANGQPVDDVTLYILGGEWDTPEDFEVDYYQNGDRHDELELLAGSYKVWVPTLEMFEFTLAPGEVRTDTFELRTANVRFSIAPELAAMLSHDEEPIEIALHNLANIESDYRGVYEILAEDGEDHEELTPDKPANWCIPYGRYEWNLEGADEYLWGEITIGPDTPGGIHLTPDNLPGLAKLEIELEGFEDDRPDIDAYYGRDLAPEIEAYGNHSVGPCIVYPSHADEVDSVGEDKKFIFVRPGPVRLEVECDRGTYSVLTRAPGKLKIRHEQCGEEALQRLQLNRIAGDAWDYEIMAVDSIGNTAYLRNEDEHYFIRVFPGSVTLHGMRTIELEGRGEVREFTTAQVVVGANGRTSDLHTLSWRPAAELTIKLIGRGDVTEPWWWTASGDEFGTPILYALDWNVGGAPRPVYLLDFDSAGDDGGPNYTYRDRQLPAGRYRLIPWAGAPENLWRTFTLKSGESRTIVVGTESD